MFLQLELGVDGVILLPIYLKEVEKSQKVQLENVLFVGNARVVEVKDVGVGERVCVDTSSIMVYGEGMLVGNKSNFFIFDT